MNYIYKKNLLTIKLKIIMETTYERFSNFAIGKTETKSLNKSEIYEFTKIDEFKFLVIHSFYILNEWIELTATMTTMEASMIFEEI